MDAELTFNACRRAVDRGVIPPFRPVTGLGRVARSADRFLITRSYEPGGAGTGLYWLGATGYRKHTVSRSSAAHWTGSNTASDAGQFPAPGHASLAFPALLSRGGGSSVSRASTLFRESPRRTSIMKHAVPAPSIARSDDSAASSPSAEIATLPESQPQSPAGTTGRSATRAAMPQPALHRRSAVQEPPVALDAGPQPPSAEASELRAGVAPVLAAPPAPVSAAGPPLPLVHRSAAPQELSSRSAAGSSALPHAGAPHESLPSFQPAGTTHEAAPPESSTPEILRSAALREGSTSAPAGSPGPNASLFLPLVEGAMTSHADAAPPVIHRAVTSVTSPEGSAVPPASADRPVIHRAVSPVSSQEGSAAPPAAADFPVIHRAVSPVSSQEGSAAPPASADRPVIHRAVTSVTSLEGSAAPPAAADFPVIHRAVSPVSSQEGSAAPPAAADFPVVHRAVTSVTSQEGSAAPPAAADLPVVHRAVSSVTSQEASAVTPAAADLPVMHPAASSVTPQEASAAPSPSADLPVVHRAVTSLTSQEGSAAPSASADLPVIHRAVTSVTSPEGSVAPPATADLPVIHRAAAPHEGSPAASAGSSMPYAGASRHLVYRAVAPNEKPSGRSAESSPHVGTDLPVTDHAVTPLETSSAPSAGLSGPHSATDLPAIHRAVSPQPEGASAPLSTSPVPHAGADLPLIRRAATPHEAPSTQTHSGAFPPLVHRAVTPHEPSSAGPIEAGVPHEAQTTPVTGQFASPSGEALPLIHRSPDAQTSSSPVPTQTTTNRSGRVMPVAAPARTLGGALPVVHLAASPAPQSATHAGTPQAKPHTAASPFVGRGVSGTGLTAEPHVPPATASFVEPVVSVRASRSSDTSLPVVAHRASAESHAQESSVQAIARAPSVSPAPENLVSRSAAPEARLLTPIHLRSGPALGRAVTRSFGSDTAVDRSAVSYLQPARRVLVARHAAHASQLSTSPPSMPLSAAARAPASPQALIQETQEPSRLPVEGGGLPFVLPPLSRSAHARQPLPFVARTAADMNSGASAERIARAPQAPAPPVSAPGAVAAPPTPQPAGPGASDPDELTEKVIRVILERLADECERRGWPQWT